MPPSRGLTIYVALHIATAVATLAAVLIVAFSGGFFPASLYADIAATGLAYFQSQFLATWIALGAPRPAYRIVIGAAGSLLVIAPPLVSEMFEFGAAWFSVKVVATTTVLPMTVVLVGLAPEWFGTRRIRFVPREIRDFNSPWQFSIRAMFVATVLAAVLVGAAQFFPLRVSDQNFGFAISAGILGIPVGSAAAAYVLLRPGRVRWLIPAPMLAAGLAGVAATAMESRGFTVQSLLVGAACAIGSLVPVGHFLILRAYGYRLITLERFPTPGM
jgi:hypothetical protein